MTKSLAGALSMFYFAERCGDEVFDALVMHHVPALADRPEWQGVTFSHALNMATGLRGGEAVDLLYEPLVLADTRAEAIANIAELGDAAGRSHLAAIGQLELIHRLSPEVIVPRAVFDEVVVVGAGLPSATEVGAAAGIRVVTPTRGDVVAALLGGGLHLGEAQAIAVAVELDADRLLIDERQGRLTAEAMGVAVVGSIGVLIAAKVRGDVPALAPHLFALRASGLWLSDALIDRVLISAGERSGA